ncbi:MAG: patatin-like phospholipase family protein [Steroidobacteraceae bacterium]
MGRLLALIFMMFAAVPTNAALPAETRSQATVAPETSPPGRLRIGLVLSGGGARGLAHIGVLRALEAQHVPIDAIAGSSMGAVVGGLYAAGMTPAEIDALMRTLDWNAAFRDRPPRNILNFRRKQDDQEFLVRFPIGIKGGSFRVPRGLIQGQRLTQILRRETVGVAGIDDFDDLPTPFRAVAADLETGERIVLGQGDLTAAMRASMSAPGVFAPVEIDSRLLVDGGLVENLPVDVVKEMGVDVVIAVDVGFQPVGRRELTSALAVSNQAITIMMLRETARQRSLLGPDDILITPDLGNLQSTDFGASDKTIDLGLGAMRDKHERLATLSIDAASWERFLAARVERGSVLPQVHFVRTDRKSERYRERIQAELAPIIGGAVDPEALDKRLSQLYGSDNFEALDYRLVRDGSLSGIEVSARRKSWGPNYLHFGLELQDDFEGTNSFNAGVRARVTEVNRYGAEWQTDLRVGANPRIRTEFYQPIGFTSDWFVAPALLVERHNLDIIEDDDRLATLRVREQQAGLDFGREFGSWGEARIGILRGSGNRTLLVGDPASPGLPPRSHFDRGELIARLSVDRLDDVYFPRDGELVTLQWNAPREAIGGEADADRISVDTTIARSFGRSTYILSATGGAAVSGPTDAVQDFYTLGGLFNLSGLSPDAISGPHFGIARAIYYRRIGSGQEGLFDVPTYLGVSLEVGDVWQRRGDASFSSARINGSAFLGFDTFLGPIYLAAGFEEGGGQSFYLLLGRIR